MGDSSDFIRRAKQAQQQRYNQEQSYSKPTRIIEKVQDFSVSYQERQLVTSAFGGLVMAVVFLAVSWLIWQQEPKTGKEWLFSFLIPLFGLFLLFASVSSFQLLIKNSPALVVNRDGITFNSLFMQTQWISWGDIAEFELRDHQGRKNQIETTLYIVPYPTSKSHGLRIPVGNLATNSDSLIESLEAYSSAIDSDRVGMRISDRRGQMP